TTLPVTQGDSAVTCGPQSLTLHASGTGILKWYDQPSGGMVTNTGNTFNTPILSNTTTYYVENVISNGTQNVGALNSTIGTGGFFTGSTYHYLRFTASNPFKLISVWVNANTNGNRTIELRNASGFVLQSINVNILTGQNRIYLNFNVPAGTDLQLGVAGSNNLYRNQTGANYPYTISNTVSITGNSANNPSYYYYFYDWEIEQSCASSRVPATAFINPTTPVNVTITANNTETCPNDTIHIYTNSTNQGSSPLYQWLINNIPSETGSSFISNSLSTGDEITCILSSSNSCATNNPDTSNVVNITVHPSPPTPNLTLVGASIYSDISLGNQWYNESGSIIGETGNSYTPEVSGNYFVIVAGPFGCVSDTSNIISFISTEVETRSDEFELKIYPNPNQGFFTIELESSSEFTIELINTIGQSIYSKSTNNKIEFVNCTDLPDGFYIIKVSHETEITSRKIIIKKAE
ncbi:MAG: T9SS type A sorting domain-containing protein, partial [Bacteroidia bacterium]|nr:T9SS type A sorting domain-containing protein [Bacteroidia bacterium]